MHAFQPYFVQISSRRFCVHRRLSLYWDLANKWTRLDSILSSLPFENAKFGVTYDDARRTLRKTNADVGEKVIAFGITEEIPNDVIAVRTDLPEDIKQQIYDILAAYIATDEGLAIMDEIYGWTDLVPAVNSEFDVVREAAEEFGLYDD